MNVLKKSKIQVFKHKIDVFYCEDAGKRYVLAECYLDEENFLKEKASTIEELRILVRGSVTNWLQKLEDAKPRRSIYCEPLQGLDSADEAQPC